MFVSNHATYAPTQPSISAAPQPLSQPDYLAFKPLGLWQKRLLVVGVALLLAFGIWALATQQDRLNHESSHAPSQAEPPSAVVLLPAA